MHIPSLEDTEADLSRDLELNRDTTAAAYSVLGRRERLSREPAEAATRLARTTRPPRVPVAGESK
jgi:hypothetical protein